MTDDFAVEVTASARKSVNAASYGIRYFFSDDDDYTFQVSARTGQYNIVLPLEQRRAVQGISSFVHRGDGTNVLRLECEGDTLRAFANGGLVDTVQDPGIARRGGTLWLATGLSAALTDPVVEVRFTDFKVYRRRRE